jgi:hypothetical protein
VPCTPSLDPNLGRQWRLIGEENILGFAGGSIDLALAPTGPIRVPYRDGNAGSISLAASDTIYMTLNFSDIDQELDGRTVVRWTGTEWLPLDAYGYYIGDLLYETSLTISATGIPYVAYGASGFTVKKFE